MTGARGGTRFVNKGKNQATADSELQALLFGGQMKLPGLQHSVEIVMTIYKV